VAFTGNKFEVRCVGASQQPSFSNFVLSVTTADSFEYLADEIVKAKASGLTVDAAVQKVVTQVFKAHQRIIQNGDGYAKSWPEEAKKRGLLNAQTTPDAIDAVDNKQSEELLARTGVLSPVEFHAHISVDYSNYAQQILLEAGCLKDISNKYIIPATIKYQNVLLQNKDSVPSSIRDKVKNLLQSAATQTDDLADKETQLGDLLGTEKAAARFAVDNVVPALKKLRTTLDALEDAVDKSFWPIPSYEDLLLSRHHDECHG